MSSSPRINAILKTNTLDSSVTGLPTFHLTKLDLNNNLDFQLPTNLRLGHLAEKAVAALFKASSNYNLLYENIQVVEDKKTIGEIDFIIQEIKTKKIIHVELAYKFYLFDPNISTEALNNWIGPNRNDSLKEKLEKTKERQFPLLYRSGVQSMLHGIVVEEVAQALCLLVSLFVPYGFKKHLSPAYEKAVKGYYLNMETFFGFDHSEKSYYLPPKKEWGMDMSLNKEWKKFEEVKEIITASIEEKRALMCWEKHGELYSVFFVVWW